MKGYRRLQWLLLSLLGLVIFAGYASLPLPNNETFPFYSWSMFSWVPGQRNGYLLRITALNGQALHPPADFQTAGGSVSGANSVKANRLIQELGLACSSGDKKRLSEIRSLFEKNHLTIGTRYQLFQINYDPLSRWKNKGMKEIPLQEWERTE